MIWADLLGSMLVTAFLMIEPVSAQAVEAERLYHCPVAQIVLAMPSNKLVCLDGAK